MAVNIPPDTGDTELDQWTNEIATQINAGAITGSAGDNLSLDGDTGQITVDNIIVGYLNRYIDTAYATNANGSENFSDQIADLPSDSTEIYQGLRNITVTDRSNNAAEFNWVQIVTTDTPGDGLGAFYKITGGRSIDWEFDINQPDGYTLDDGSAVIDLDDFAAEQGAQGQFQIDIYLNTDTAPTEAPVGGSYDFAGDTVTPPDGGWTVDAVTPPAGETTYTSSFIYDPANDTDPIVPIWGVPVIAGDTGPQGEQGDQGETGDKGDAGDKGDTGDTGDTGLAGDISKTIYLYDAAVTLQPVPSNTQGFNTSTGDAESVLTWTTEVPSIVAGEALFIAIATVTQTNANGAYASSTGWTGYQAQGFQGEQGIPGQPGGSGPRFESLTLYTDPAVAIQPAAPAATLTWDTGVISIALPAVWSETPPTEVATSNLSVYSSRLLFVDTSGNQATTTVTGDTPVQAINFSGLVTFTGGDFALDGATITNIDGGNITTNTITADEIATNTITATQIAADTITATQIAADTITASEIAANTITATQIAADTITASEIAADTITASEIASNTITATQISTDYIYAGTLSADNITAGTIDGSNVTVGDIALNTDGGQPIPQGDTKGSILVGIDDGGGSGTTAGDFVVGSNSRYVSWDESTGIFEIQGDIVNVGTPFLQADVGNPFNAIVTSNTNINSLLDGAGSYVFVLCGGGGGGIGTQRPGDRGVGGGAAGIAVFSFTWDGTTVLGVTLGAGGAGVTNILTRIPADSGSSSTFFYAGSSLAICNGGQGGTIEGSNVGGTGGGAAVATTIVTLLSSSASTGGAGGTPSEDRRTRGAGGCNFFDDGSGVAEAADLFVSNNSVVQGGHGGDSFNSYNIDTVNVRRVMGIANGANMIGTARGFLGGEGQGIVTGGGAVGEDGGIFAGGGAAFSDSGNNDSGTGGSSAAGGGGGGCWSRATALGGTGGPGILFWSKL